VSISFATLALQMTTTASVRFGIASFVYSRRRPFHPNRLMQATFHPVPLLITFTHRPPAPPLYFLLFSPFIHFCFKAAILQWTCTDEWTTLHNQFICSIIAILKFKNKFTATPKPEICIPITYYCFSGSFGLLFSDIPLREQENKLRMLSRV
jgi:hypothetical protein